MFISTQTQSQNIIIIVHTHVHPYPYLIMGSVPVPNWWQFVVPHSWHSLLYEVTLLAVPQTGPPVPARSSLPVELEAVPLWVQIRDILVLRVLVQFEPQRAREHNVAVLVEHWVLPIDNTNAYLLTVLTCDESSFDSRDSLDRLSLRFSEWSRV